MRPYTLLLVLLFMIGEAAAQAYPAKTVRIVVPFPPSGAADIIARVFAPKFAEALGQPIVIDNRAGANGNVGTEIIARSAPDGYGLLFGGSGTLAISPSLYAKLPFDPVRDFVPIGLVAVQPHVLAVHPSVRAKSVKELIALAKSRPGQLNFASAGSGSVVHLAGELFNIAAKIKTQHIPYKGAGPALTDLIGGQVQMYFAVPTSAIPYIKTGRLKANATGGERRSPALPQGPTFSEAGLSGFNMGSWHGVITMACAPKEIIDKISTEIAKILTMPDIKEKLLSQGMDPFISTPASNSPR